VVARCVSSGGVRGGSGLGPSRNGLFGKLGKVAAWRGPGVKALLALDDLAPVMLKRRMLRHSNSGAPLDHNWGLYAIVDQLIWRVPGSISKCSASAAQPGSCGSTAIPPLP